MIAGNTLPDATTLRSLLGDNVLSLDQLHAASVRSLNRPKHDRIVRVSLVEVLIVWQNLYLDSMVYHGRDVNRFSWQPACSLPHIPLSGIIAQAKFHFHFTDFPEPVPVIISPPDCIDVEPPGVLPGVLRWAQSQGLVVKPANHGGNNEQHHHSMAIP